MKGKLFSLSMVILAAFALFLGLTQMQHTSFVHAARQDDRFYELEKFTEVMNLIKSSYVDNVSDEVLVQGAIKGMLKELDPHSSYFTPDQFKSFQVDMKGEFGGLGMTIGMRDNAVTIIAPIEDTPAYKAGLMAGDVIYKIDDTVTTDMTTEEAVKLMRGAPGTKVTLTILRKGEAQPMVFNLERAVIHVKAVKYQMLDNKIGYLRLTNFQENSGNEVKEALQALQKDNATGIIFDLRFNPGGSLVEAVNVSSLFLPSGKVVVTTKGRDDKGTSLSTKAFAYRDTTTPLVILVDEGSASASEIVAGAIQDYGRGVIVGNTTFGKSSVQSLIELHGGGAVKLTTARYYTPNGRSLQSVGIVPDVSVPRGKIVYAETGITIKESDLAGHLIGENEGAKTAEQQAAPAQDADNQLQSAIQIIKGLTVYSKNGKK